MLPESFYFRGLHVTQHLTQVSVYLWRYINGEVNVWLKGVKMHHYIGSRSPELANWDNLILITRVSLLTSVEFRMNRLRYIAVVAEVCGK